MGLNRPAIKLIAESVRDQHMNGRVLILGKQDIWGTEQEVIRWLKESGVTPTACTVEISRKDDFRRLGFIQDTSLFKLLGFREAVTLDYSDYEQAEIICDLGEPLPSEVAAKAGLFELVIDAGCLEHIFNLPQAMSNLHRLTAPGGVVIHISPSSNYVDHGFYMFSPTLFHDYYGANRWQILQHFFFQHSPNYQAAWKVYEYRPGGLFAFAFSGGLNRLMCGIFVAAKKGPESTCDAKVHQGLFAAAWKDAGAATAAGSERPESGKVGWAAFREQLKPYVPRMLIPFLLATEARLKTARGIGRYLKRRRCG